MRWRNWSSHSSERSDEHKSNHGIPNLEREIEKSPVLFVQALALIFRREDGGEDPPWLANRRSPTTHRRRYGRLPIAWTHQTHSGYRI